MKRINSFFFGSVVILLCLFTYSASINLGFEADDGGGQGYMFYVLSISGLDAFFVLTILFNFKKIKLNKNIFIVCLWIILMILTQLFSKRFITDIPQVLLWALCFLSFYLFVRSNNERFFCIANWYIAYFCIGFIVFLFVSITRTALMLDNSLAGTNNIFYPLLILPWILVQRKRFLKNVLILLLLFAVIISTKRSAMLIVFLTLIPYLYYGFIKNKQIPLRTRILSPIVLLFLFVLVFVKINDSVDGYIWKRFESIEEDKGSGRLDIYANVYNMQNSSDIGEWIFGHGHQGVLRNYNGPWGEFSAHNDFQEVLYDYGIVMLLLYFYLYIVLFKRLCYLYKIKSDFFVSYCASFLLFVIMSTMSHLILYSTYFIFLTSYWGAIEGMICNNKEKSNLLY